MSAAVLAGLHPRLQRTVPVALAEHARRYPRRPRLTPYSGARGQIDCRRIVGPCSPHSKHGRRPAEALDLGGYPKDGDVAVWREFGALIQQIDPCIEAGVFWRSPDPNHIEIQWDRPGCRGGAVDEGRAVGGSILRNLMGEEGTVSARIADRLGVPHETVPVALTAAAVLFALRLA